MMNYLRPDVRILDMTTTIAVVIAMDTATIIPAHNIAVDFLTITRRRVCGLRVRSLPPITIPGHMDCTAHPTVMDRTMVHIMAMVVDMGTGMVLPTILLILLPIIPVTITELDTQSLRRIDV